MRIMQKTAPITILTLKSQGGPARCYQFPNVTAVLSKNGKFLHHIKNVH